jgi:hypothetical protein
MTSRAEAIAVNYLEREVKRLEAKVSRLEKRLKARESALSIAIAGNKKAQTARPKLRTGRNAEAERLRKVIEALRKDRAMDTGIIDEQRDLIATLKVGLNREPMNVLDKALEYSKFSPRAVAKAKEIFQSRAPFEVIIGKLLEAYDAAMRVAARSVSSPPNNSFERTREG